MINTLEVLTIAYVVILDTIENSTIGILVCGNEIDQ